MTQEELIETITHLAFYCGWPNAVNAVNVAKEVFDKIMSYEGRLSGEIMQKQKLERATLKFSNIRITGAIL